MWSTSIAAAANLFPDGENDKLQIPFRSGDLKLITFILFYPLHKATASHTKILGFGLRRYDELKMKVNKLNFFFFLNLA